MYSIQTQNHEDGMAIDVIGDIHGYYQEVCALLLKLGYSRDKNTGVFKAPPKCMAVFIGDYIDRGPDSIAVIKLIKSMVDNGSAQAILGNHDFNAVLWKIPHPDEPGEFLRSHDERNHHFHKAFLHEVSGMPENHDFALRWIKTLPVYLKIGNFNFVHACWSPSTIETLTRSGCLTQEGRITDKGWIVGGKNGTPENKMLEILMMGPKIILPASMHYMGREGTIKKDARVAWWNEDPKNFVQAFTGLPPDVVKAFAQASCPPLISGSPTFHIQRELRAMPTQEKIFIGHIWENGLPAPLSDKICCVDYSVAMKGGILAAYRIKGKEIDLKPEDFVWVERMDALKSVAEPIAAQG